MPTICLPNSHNRVDVGLPLLVNDHWRVYRYRGTREDYIAWNWREDPQHAWKPLRIKSQTAFDDYVLSRSDWDPTTVIPVVSERLPPGRPPLNGEPMTMLGFTATRAQRDWILEQAHYFRLPKAAIIREALTYRIAHPYTPEDHP